MFTKSEAKDRILKLVEKYERLSPQRKRTYSEADTRRDFIMPLFSALGWDVYNDITENEVVEEETSITGRIDYSFRLNNNTQFVLEAKAIPEDLDRERWANQAVEYGWNKGVPWVVLTDFEGLKVFNSEWKNKYPRANIDLTYKIYLEKFDKLWLLSKESFQENKLDKLLTEFGVAAKRESVNEHLAKDLLEWRKSLTHYFSSWNKDVKLGDIEEAVQRILDRLIFMRVVEDKGIEEKRLWQAFKKWEENDYEPQNFIEKLVPIFREFDYKYNSNLFEEHLCENLYTTQEPFKKILPDLYGSKEGSVKYRFDAIDANVLGNVYEQYLGYVQGRDGGKAKRKRQGIYYTPTYIVDYIVQNTLGRLLEEKNLREIENIKVLDPACGSGSFLIKAFDVLNEKIKKTRNQKSSIDAALRKYSILKKNIYGVDLDSQAVEIARLNLLLKSLEPNHKLPMLNENIKMGNSLIEDKGVTGAAFEWKKEYKEVFEGGGFDVVIGNPPYLKEMDNKNIFEPIKNSGYVKYYQGKMDLWYFFLHRAIDVAKEGGFIGFITNSYFLKSAGASKLIERIKNELVLTKAVDLGDTRVFGDVSGKHIIHIYQKRKVKRSDKSTLITFTGDKLTDSIDEKNRNEVPYQKLITNNKINFEVAARIDFKNCVPLGNIYDVSVGIQESTDKVSNKQLTPNDSFRAGDGVFILSKVELENMNLNANEKGVIKKYLNTNNVGKYFISFSGEYLIYSDKEAKQKTASGLYPNIKNHLDKMKKFITSSNKPYGLHRPREGKYFESPKLICKGMFLTPEFCYDIDKYYVGFSFSVIIQKGQNYSLKYLLAILNSSLGKYWFNINGKRRGVGVDIGVAVFRQFPIFIAGIDQQKSIEILVDKVMELYKQIQDTSLNTDKWYSIKSEIERTDRKIDDEVYKLYGLTPKEIEIVEKS